MGKALIVVAMSLLACGVLNAAEKNRAPVGCVKSVKGCNCYSQSGRQVEVTAEICEAKFTPTTFTRFEKGDITALVTHTRVKPPEPEKLPFQKSPVPWLIEH